MKRSKDSQSPAARLDFIKRRHSRYGRDNDPTNRKQALCLIEQLYDDVGFLLDMIDAHAAKTDFEEAARQQSSASKYI